MNEFDKNPKSQFEGLSISSPMKESKGCAFIVVIMTIVSIVLGGIVSLIAMSLH